MCRPANARCSAQGGRRTHPSSETTIGTPVSYGVHAVALDCREADAPAPGPRSFAAAALRLGWPDCHACSVPAGRGCCLGGVAAVARVPRVLDALHAVISSARGPGRGARVVRVRFGRDSVVAADLPQVCPLAFLRPLAPHVHARLSRRREAAPAYLCPDHACWGVGGRRRLETAATSPLPDSIASRFAARLRSRVALLWRGWTCKSVSWLLG